MSDVFISYSRKDEVFVSRLLEALTEDKQQDVWVDWQSIRPSQSWWREIQRGIASTNNFLVVLSPNSMASPICQLEIEYALNLRKRIVPILYSDYDINKSVDSVSHRLNSIEGELTRKLWGEQQVFNICKNNDSALREIQFFYFTPEQIENNFDKHLEELFQVVRADYEYKELHTTLQIRAQQWEDRRRDSGFLLMAGELADAERWLETARSKEPQPTILHEEYIYTSRKAENNRQRILRTFRNFVFLAAAATTLLLIIAISLANNARISAQDVNEANRELKVADNRLATQEAAAVNIEATASAALEESSINITAAAIVQAEAAALQPTLTSLEDRELSQDIEQEMRRRANPEIVTLLGIYGFEVSDNPDVDSTLIESVDNLRTIQKFCPDVRSEIQFVDISPDGRWLIAADNTQTIYIMDSDNFEEQTRCIAPEITYDIDADLLDLHFIPSDEDSLIEEAILIVTETDIRLLSGFNFQMEESIEIEVGDNCESEFNDCVTPRIVVAGFHPLRPRYLILGGERGDVYIWDRIANLMEVNDITSAAGELNKVVQLSTGSVNGASNYQGRVNKISVSSIGDDENTNAAFVVFGGENGNVFIWEMTFAGNQLRGFTLEEVPDLGLVGDIADLTFGTVNNYPTHFVAITGQSELVVYNATDLVTVIPKQTLSNSVEDVVFWDNPLVVEPRYDLILAGPNPTSDVGGLIQIRTYDQNGAFEEFLRFDEHAQGSVLAIAVTSPASDSDNPLFTMLSGDTSGEIRYWDLLRVRLPQRLYSVDGVIGSVNQLAIRNNDDDVIVYAAGSQIISLMWDDRVEAEFVLSQHEREAIAERNERNVQFIELLPDEKKSLIAVYDNTIRQYDVNGSENNDPIRLTDGISSLAYDENEDLIYVGTGNRIQTFALGNTGFSSRHSVIIDTQDASRTVNSLAVTPNTEVSYILASVSEDIYIYTREGIEESNDAFAIISAENGIGHQNVITDLRFDKTGKWVVSADNGGRIILWSTDPSSDKYLRYVVEFQAEGSPNISSVDIITHAELFKNHQYDVTENSENHIWIVGGWASGEVQLWRYTFDDYEDSAQERNIIGQEQDIRIYSGHSAPITDLRFYPSPAGEPAPWIFSASSDGSIRRWDVQTRQEFICYAYRRIFRRNLIPRERDQISDLLGTIDNSNPEISTRYDEEYAGLGDDCIDEE